MGQIHGKKRNARNASNKSETKPTEEMICPYCNIVFYKSITLEEFNEHIKQCSIESNKKDKKEETKVEPPKTGPITEPKVEPPVVKKKEEPDIIKQQLENRLKNFASKKKKFKNVPKNEAIDVKITELKKNISRIKISWEEGCCYLKVSRENLLLQSMDQMNKVNLFKELKIEFKGELSNDAGGIMREWFTIIFKELQDPKMGLFISSNVNDFSYIINPLLLETKRNLEYFNFIGKLMGKALLDNNTINVCFNKLIYKLILEEEIKFEDLIFVDKDLFHSLDNLKKINNNNEIEELCLFFSLDIQDTKGRLHNFEFKEGGDNLLIKNKDDLNFYIDKRIDFYISSILPFVEEIKKGFNKIIPQNYISNFTSDELELVINGRPFIDIEEWMIFTEYKEPYNPQHYLIKWFWEILNKLSPKQLSNILQFSTGSARVPLGGFAELESNRSTKARFTIEKIDFIRGRKNFIKAHTCFNRIDIPLFETKQQLEDAIMFVADYQILGFGID